MTNPTNAAPELLPCPFCGDVPVSLYGVHAGERSDKWGGVQCCIQGPEVRTGYGPVEDWRDDAVRAWNTRADLAPKLTLTQGVLHVVRTVLKSRTVWLDAKDDGGTGVREAQADADCLRAILRAAGEKEA